jgi:hypothetical protein
MSFVIESLMKRGHEIEKWCGINVAGDKNYYYANVWLSLWSVLFDLNLH